MTSTDFLIIGAGIVGLSIARELKIRNARASILILEKEEQPGKHSSGRNSGVLHSGIYYPPETLKAKVCRQGAIEMADYHVRNNLPLDRRGKILVATRPEDAPQVEMLSQRARLNGVEAEIIDAHELKKMEPAVRSASDQALFVPSTAVGSPKEVLQTLIKEILSAGITLRCGVSIDQVIPKRAKLIINDGETIEYGHCINASGLHADKVAHLFNVGEHYTLLPFKGIYWKLSQKAPFSVDRLIYPVPDLRVPFLGIHTTTTTNGVTYLGPTAVPAFGRENYYGFDDVKPREFANIIRLLIRQFVSGQDGFRRLAWQEGRRYYKPWFVEAARKILPKLKSKDLLPTMKVGIRAQMLDLKSDALINDFLVESGPRSTHILNAISPAWTSAFPFARYVCNHYIEKG